MLIRLRISAACAVGEPQARPSSPVYSKRDGKVYTQTVHEIAKRRLDKPLYVGARLHKAVIHSDGWHG